MRLWAKIAIGVVGAFVAVGVIAVATGPSSPPTVSAAPVAPAAAASPTPADVAAPAVAAGLTCSDVGAKFVAHGSDGRGDCMSIDPRPKCHVAPANQDGNYLAELTMTPPFPGGTIDNPSEIAAASNADCWKLPAGR